MTQSWIGFFGHPGSKQADDSRRQLFEQRLGLFQIERVEAFGEPAVDRSEKITGLIALALIAEERHAPRRMQGRLLLMTEVYAGIFANL